MTGFRITVVLQDFTNCALDKKKCLVFLEDGWIKVADLEAHMMKVLGVNRLEVFIEDCWVSSEEPICIIKPSDTITVRQVENLPEQSSNASTHVCQKEGIQEKKEKRPKKKKVENSPVRSVDEPEVQDDAALAAKKEELLLKVEAALGHEEMDVTDDASLPPPTKKRRHRKRPSKKRKEFLERLSVGATLLSCVEQQTDSVLNQFTCPEEVSTRPTNSQHIRFDEETRQSNYENAVVGPDEPKEDWQERLLALAQERSKPVFIRTEIFNGKNSDLSVHQNGATNGFCGDSKMNGDDSLENGEFDVDACHSSLIHNSIPTVTANANDLLYFKKLTVADGKPEVSDHLLALVEEVDDSGVLVLKIFEGRAEQTFTPDEIQDSEDGCFVVRVDWKNIIEPRLIVDASVLSKYL